MFVGPIRAAEKARDDYGDRAPGPALSWLFDVARAKIVCQSAAQIAAVIEALRALSDSGQLQLRR